MSTDRLEVSEESMSAGSVDALAMLSFAVMGRLSRVAAVNDLSLTQLRMLAILRDRSPRMAELADALGTDRSSVTGLIVRAEKRGLVERELAAGDKRGITVTLTAAGHEFAASVTRETGVALEHLLAALDSSERRTMAELVAKLSPDHEGTPGTREQG